MIGQRLRIKFFFNVYLFLRDRARQSMSRGGAERGGDTESKAGSRLPAVRTEPDTRLDLNCEIMTGAKVQSLTDRATQVPQNKCFKNKNRGSWVAQSVKRPTSAQAMILPLWVRAPCRALCRQLGAWSLLWILCLPLTLPLPHSCSVSLSVKNK